MTSKVVWNLGEQRAQCLDTCENVSTFDRYCSRYARECNEFDSDQFGFMDDIAGHPPTTPDSNTGPHLIS